MRWFLNRLSGWITGRRPRLRCDRSVWIAGVEELARRTLGQSRESGAYLLGPRLPNGSGKIVEFAFYDDIDPAALDSGIVTIRQTALPKLWELCRSRGYGVLADVHVHPGCFEQSESDQANPVMPRSGHVAIILPDFAVNRPEPGRIGIYEFLGSGRWRNHTAKGARVLRLETGA